MDEGKDELFALRHLGTEYQSPGVDFRHLKGGSERAKKKTPPTNKANTLTPRTNHLRMQHGEVEPGRARLPGFDIAWCYFMRPFSL